MQAAAVAVPVYFEEGIAVVAAVAGIVEQVPAAAAGIVAVAAADTVVVVVDTVVGAAVAVVAGIVGQVADNSREPEVLLETAPPKIHLLYRVFPQPRAVHHSFGCSGV